MVIIKKLQLGETQRVVPREFKMCQTSVFVLQNKFQATVTVKNLKSDKPEKIDNSREKSIMSGVRKRPMDLCQGRVGLHSQ